MDHNPLLSICIPTYNQTSCLKECLESIIPQARTYKIPIYVSANDPSKTTLEILFTLKQNYPYLYFKSTDGEICYDRNVMSAVQMSSSRYVWTIGDRRRLLPNAIDMVYDILNNHEVDLLVLNISDLSFSAPKKSQKYESARKVCRELLNNLSCLGLQILPLEAWKSAVLEKYVGDAWIQIGAALEFIAREKVNVLFISDLYLRTAIKSESFFVEDYFQIWSSWKKTISSLPEFYSDADKETATKNTSYEFHVNDLLYLRSRGIYNTEIFDKYGNDITFYGGLSRNVVYAISKLPVLPLKTVYKIYFVLRNIAHGFFAQQVPLNPLIPHNRSTHAFKSNMAGQSHKNLRRLAKSD
jgi:glycosyltransferase involved in cell wall biosynthesis